MTDSEQPEIELVDDSRTAQPDASLVLAADVLPEDIYIITGSQKPVFPGMMFPVMSGGDMAAIFRQVAAQDKVIGFVLSREELPAAADRDTIRKVLYEVGTAVRIVNLEEAPDGSVNALLQAVRRFEVLQIRTEGERIIAHVVYLPETSAKGDEIKAMALSIMNTMRELVKHNPIFSEEIRTFLSRGSWDDPGRLADFCVSMTSAEGEELQEILETLDVRQRLEKALFLLRKELSLNELKEKITHQIEEKITKQQREFFLHEQLKAIKSELGLEKDEKTEELERYQARIAELTLSDEARDRVDEELEKLRMLPQQSPEYSVVRNYLDWLTQLPWGIVTEDHLDVGRARQVLDREHHGLQDVKDRILEFIGVSRLKGQVGGSILCLVGPPGTGKTSLGRAVAAALGREFYRFSLGGMRDEAEIKGHRRTYIGAMPGKILQTLKYTGTQNPVIMLDEIDKVGVSYQGDPASALLEVLDPEQNCDFHDHYLDVAFDLSKVLFIATANVQDTIPGPLLDRMEMIRLSGYLLEEKLQIAKRHLIPKQVKEHGLTAKQVRFNAAGIRHMINGYAREAGVRSLEKAIRSCLRKVAARLAEHEGEWARVTIGREEVESYLGRPIFTDDILNKYHCAGVATGLAWTAYGGSVLFIESMAIDSKEGGFRHTGQLGDVMIESSSIAVSLVTSRRLAYGIADDFFQTHTVHLHVPEGATPKDGPSAGITMATALISMATGQCLPKLTAMTGELTLTGAVLPVGGIREKIVAAKRLKIVDILLPQANEREFDEMPADVRKGVYAHFVDSYDQVHDYIFGGGIEAARKARR